MTDEREDEPGAAGAAGSWSPERTARYQRTRLWIGIGGIGSIVTGSWLLVVGCVPCWLNDALADRGAWGGAFAAGFLGLLALAVQLPMDLLGRRTEAAFGQLVEHDAARPCSGRWWGSWAAAAAPWLGGLMLAGLLVGLAVELDPERWTTWTLLAIAAATLADLAVPAVPGRAWEPVPAARAAFQDWLDDVRRELRSMGLVWPPVRWFDHGERSLAGSWHGLGPLRQLALSRTVSEMPPRIAAALVARELAHRSRADRVLGWAMSMAWIALAVGVADLALPSLLAAARPEARPVAVESAETADPGPVAARDERSTPLPAGTNADGDPLVTPGGAVAVLAIVMTNACFVGLFVWPAVGRRQVLAADRFPLHRGMPAQDVLAMLDALAERNRPDETLPRAKAHVFHPIPPMDARRTAIREAARLLRRTDDAAETDAAAGSITTTTTRPSGDD